MSSNGAEGLVYDSHVTSKRNRQKPKGKTTRGRSTARHGYHGTEEFRHQPDADLDEFRAWFAQFDAEAWDREFERDAKSGKLDRLADKALADLVQGRCSAL
jgi:hypothetical protein